MRIGLLEDDPAICDMMQEMLQAAGHSVTAYQDGSDILATFHLEEPTALPPLFEILLVDLILPGDMTGEQVIHHVRMISPSLPIVVISAVATSHLQAVARRYPGVRALQKPFKLRDLFAVIQGEASSHLTLSGQTRERDA
jgi:two-component system OmpR family response regulator